MSEVLTARDLSLVACRACGLLCRDAIHGTACYCPRCGAGLHSRKPYSYQRTLSCLLAAAALYVPSNLLIVMRTGSALYGTEDHTIMGGIIELWQAGSWDLAVIVFVASIMVPILKFAALGTLLYAVHRGRDEHLLRHAKLYRLIESIGHWSMLDVFVVALLSALVQFSTLAVVVPGPGIAAFGMVVVLTMLASASFDPRLLWDMEQDRATARLRRT